MSKEEIINPVWEIDAPSVEDNSMVEYEFAEYRNVDVTANGQFDGPYRIDTRDRDLFLLMRDAYVEVRYKLQDALRQDFAAAAVGPPARIVNPGVIVESALQLFRSSRYYMEDKLICEQQEPARVFAMSRLGEMSQGNAQKDASNMIFYVDEAKIAAAPAALRELNQPFTTVDDANDLVVNNPTYLPSFIKRLARTSPANLQGSKVVTAYIPLRFLAPVVADFGKVWRGIRHSLVLDKQTTYQKTVFGFDNGAQFTTAITRLSLWCPIVKPSLDVLSNIDSKLMSNSQISVRWIDYSFYPATGYGNAVNGEQRYRITTNVSKPTRVYAAFHKTDRDTTYLQPALQNDLVNVGRCQLRVNSKQFPREEYQWDHTTLEGFERIYNDWLRIHNKLGDEESSSCLSYEEFSQIYPMFCFDTSKGEDNLYKTNSAVDLEFRWVHNANSGAAYSVDFVVCAEKEIKLDLVSGAMVVSQT